MGHTGPGKQNGFTVAGPLLTETELPTEQEILISTPRRFGKTISVSMFAAAMVFSVPNLECSIYSTCKRISQKLLRNIQKFLDLIYAELGVQAYPVVRSNMEEVVVKGPHSNTDTRIVNSYPSKV